LENIMAKTVLVTGGTGYVAGWCIVELLKRGYDVRTTVRAPAKEASVRKAVASVIDPGNALSFFIADLTKDECWDAAVAGCDYVLHVASPLGGDAPRDPNALIAPAHDGTLRVLRAACSAHVERVVITSSTAACAPAPASPDSINDETMWTDPNARGLVPYRQSKVLAERAAWDFMKTQTGRTTLTTVLPSAILGPVLSTENLGSVQLVSRMLNGKMPGTPNFGFNIVDVRDVAEVHIRAMTSPEAAGQRLIATSSFMWMAEVAATLRGALGERASKVPTRRLPDFVLRLASIFDHAARQVTPSLGHKHTFVSTKAQRMLEWTPRKATDAVVDCGESLLASGFKV
jgi:nucleoside-diphosphate-sugar epimerase